MDKRLYGKTILIGREANTSRLKLMMNVDGAMKETSIGEQGSVPSSVSRCMDDRAHCSIEIHDAKNLKVTNLNVSNCTKVNCIDREIHVKCVELTENLQIFLGSENYRLDVAAVLSAASGLLPQVYDIKPLEKVWNDYEAETRDFRLKRERFNVISSITGILSSCGMICMFVPGFEHLRILFLVITLILSVFFLMVRISAPKKNIEKEQQIKTKFTDNYICPNPNCKRFVGNTPYNLLRQNKNCQYCRAKWTEN